MSNLQIGLLLAERAAIRRIILAHGQLSTDGSRFSDHSNAMAAAIKPSLYRPSRDSPCGRNADREARAVETLDRLLAAFRRGPIHQPRKLTADLASLGYAV